jgi:hypothetical protein
MKTALTVWMSSPALAPGGWVRLAVSEIAVIALGVAALLVMVDAVDLARLSRLVLRPHA